MALKSLGSLPNVGPAAAPIAPIGEGAPAVSIEELRGPVLPPTWGPAAGGVRNAGPVGEVGSLRPPFALGSNGGLSPAKSFASFLARADPTEATLGRDAELLRSYFQTGQFGELAGQGGKTLRYAVFAPPEGVPVKGVVTLVTGTRESMTNYAELLFNLRHARAEGYAVAVMDHRGQGYSDKEIPGKLHVNDSNDFVRDQRSFRGVLEKHFGQEVPYSIMGHSLGGAVAARYVQQFPDDYGKLVMMSPMLDIDTGFSKKTEEHLAKSLKAIAPERYALGQTPYRAAPPFRGNKDTTSEARFEFVADQYRRNESSQVDGVTNMWVHQSMKLDRALFANAERLKALGERGGEVHILVPSNDTMVETASTRRFAQSIGVEPKTFDARHHLLQSPDATRTQVLETLKSLLFTSRESAETT